MPFVSQMFLILPQVPPLHTVSHLTCFFIYITCFCSALDREYWLTVGSQKEKQHYKNVISKTELYSIHLETLMCLYLNAIQNIRFLTFFLFKSSSFGVGFIWGQTAAPPLTNYKSKLSLFLLSIKWRNENSAYRIDLIIK